jgi:hypothetical protein
MQKLVHLLKRILARLVGFVDCEGWRKAVNDLKKEGGLDTRDKWEKIKDEG